LNKQSFTQLLTNKTHITQEDSDEIEDVMKSYPFFQSAYLLIAKAHSEKGSMFTNQKVRKSSLFVSSRTKLKHILSQEFEIDAESETTNFTESSVSNKIESNFTENVTELNLPQPAFENKETVVIQKPKINNDVIIDEIERTLNEIKANKIYKEEKKKFNESHHIVTENEGEVVNLHPVFPSQQVLNEDKKPSNTSLTSSSSTFEKNTVSEDKVSTKLTQPKLTNKEAILSEIEQSLNEIKSNKIYLEEKEKYRLAHQKQHQNKTVDNQTPAVDEIVSNDKLNAESSDPVNKYYVHTPEFGNETKEAKESAIDEYLSYRSTGFVPKPKLDEQLNIIQKFIEIEPSISRSMDVEDAEFKVDLSEESTVENNFMVSENYANILIKQGKKEKAKKILQQLIQKFPEKSTHYSERINELEK
jgi:tetratricopeptide (TPR) repeat protein